MREIPGKEIAQKIIDDLKSRPKPKKILAAVLVGESSQSESFLKQKEKAAKELGIDFRVYKLSADLGNDGLRKEIGRIANQKPVGGIIVQLPLPEGLNKHYILNAIQREKDVDVLGERALGAFYTGRNPVLPPAVGVVDEVLRIMNYELGIMKVAVVGLGFLVGKPISEWLKGKAKEVYLLRSSSGLEILKEADLVISGVGKAGLIKPEMLKDGAGVIDFGYSIGDDGKIHGDFSAELITNNLQLTMGWYTPTPGGTGPILVAKLLSNFYELCRESS